MALEAIDLLFVALSLAVGLYNYIQSYKETLNREPRCSARGIIGQHIQNFQECASRAQI